MSVARQFEPIDFIAISFETLVRRIAALMRVAQKIDMARTSFVKFFRGRNAALIIVATDGWDSFRQVAVKGNDRQTNVLVFLDAKIVGTGNDAVNLICNQHFEIVALFFLVLGRVAQDNLIAGIEKFFFDALHQFGVKRVHDRRKNNADQVRALTVKRACKRIWLIVELFHRTVDPLSCFFADISVVVNDARNGRFGNAGFFGDIGQFWSHKNRPFAR